MEILITSVKNLLIAGGGGALIAYGIFRFLGAKWIESKFSDQLQKLKHSHDQELERLRFQINATLDRASKLHQKEFEVLPHVWENLIKAIGQVRSFVSLMETWPDFQKMSDPHFEEFLDQSTLPNFQKDELRKAHDRSKCYREIMFWRNLAKAKEQFWNFHNNFEFNKIFLQPELKSLFTKADDLMWGAIVAREVGREANAFDMQVAAWDKMTKELQPVLDSIESLVQNRLDYKALN